MRMSINLQLRLVTRDLMVAASPDGCRVTRGLMGGLSQEGLHSPVMSRVMSCLVSLVVSLSHVSSLSLMSCLSRTDL